jgi:NADPH:quinone reductase-like Zn-dependent oxidoreductase
VGDRVYGLVAGGGLAEIVVVHERLLAAVPSNLDLEQAAAVPEAFITAHDALENQARLRPGESVLIHAVAGGVGLAAAQIARASGCPVLGTSRTAWKLERAVELGVSVGIDTSRDEFAQVVLRETAGQGVPVLIDLLGAMYWKANLEALAARGRLVLVGLLTGQRVEGADLGTLLRKRLTVVGTTLRARGLEEKIEATRAFAERVNPWLERGVVRPVVDRVFGFEEIREAEEYLESNESFGKVVVSMPGC